MSATYEIKPVTDNRISLAPESEVAEILQNVQTIISTVRGSVPLDREFGIDGRIIDMPIHQAQAHLSNDIFQQIKRYEPRAKISDITFTATQNGVLIPKVMVTV